MVLTLGVGLFPTPVQGAESAVLGHANNVARDSSTPSVGISDPWVPPWQVQPSFDQVFGTQAHVPRDPFAPVVIEYVSPSALETLVMCPRKWAFPKLDRVPRDSSDAAELGTATHGQHERFFIEGIPYDLTTREGELALATSHMLPDRDTPGLRIEQEIRFQHPELPGVWFGGKIDLNWEQPTGAVTGDGPRWIRVVLDHKTTGKLENAKLVRAQLLTHPQAPMYAEMFFVGVGQERVEVDRTTQWIEWRGHAGDAVELRWNYVLTKGKPKPYKSWHVVKREENAVVFREQVIAPARRLLAIVDQANAERAARRTFGAAQVEANPGSACFAFGGCPFRSLCKIEPIEGVKNMSGGVPNFLNRLGVGAAPGQPPQGQQPVTQHSPTQPQGGQPWAGPPQGAPPQRELMTQGGVPLPGGTPQWDTNTASPGYGQRINPPENGTAAPPDPKAEEKARKKAEKEAAKLAKTAAGETESEAHAPALSFEATAVSAVMGALAGSLAESIYSGKFTPESIAECAVAIVARAVQLGVK